MGAAVVERLAVGRPGGKHLKLCRVVLDVGHLVLLYVVGYEVAAGVEHLNLVVVAGVENLAGEVGTIDDERQPRVPGWIDAGREDGVVAHVDFAQVAVVVDDRAAVVLAGVELHAPGVILLEVVAVDALPLGLGAAEHVVDHYALGVVFQAALVERQFLVGDIRRRDEAVADVGVDAVVRHFDSKGLVAPPLVAAARKHLDAHLPALGSRCQLAPFVGGGLHGLAATNHLPLADGEPRHDFVAGAVPLKSQRCNIHWDGDIAVVGIDGRRLVCAGIVCRHLSMLARRQQCHQRNYL